MKNRNIYLLYKKHRKKKLFNSFYRKPPSLILGVLCYLMIILYFVFADLSWYKITYPEIYLTSIFLLILYIYLFPLSEYLAGWILSKEYGGRLRNKLLTINSDGLIVEKGKQIPWKDIRRIFRVRQIFILKQPGILPLYLYIDGKIMYDFLQLLSQNNVKIHTVDIKKNKLYEIYWVRQIYSFFLLLIYIIIFLLNTDLLLILSPASIYAILIAWSIGLIIDILLLPWGVFKTYEIKNGWVELQLLGRTIRKVKPAPSVSYDYYEKYMDKRIAELYWFANLDKEFEPRWNSDKRIKRYRFLAGFMDIYLSLEMWRLFILSFLRKREEVPSR